MQLALTVVAVVVLCTVAVGLVGYLIDRSTEQHADRGNRQ